MTEATNSLHREDLKYIHVYAFEKYIYTRHLQNHKNGTQRSYGLVPALCISKTGLCFWASIFHQNVHLSFNLCMSAFLKACRMRWVLCFSQQVICCSELNSLRIKNELLSVFVNTKTQG